MIDRTPPREARDEPMEWIPPMELDPARAVPAPRVPDPAPSPPPFEAEPDAAMPEAEFIPPVAGPAPRSPLLRWLVGAVALLILVAVGFDTADLMDRAFATSMALGVVVSLVAGVAGITTVALLVRELRSLKRLRRIEELRVESRKLSHTMELGRADRFAGSLTRLYGDRPDLQPDLARLKDVVTDAHDDAEVVRLIDREVLTGLDRRAYQTVLRASRDTALATALSPAALLDIVVVVWRNLKLVREIATLYGARPGYVGSLRLLRRMLGNIAVAGVTESAHHVAVDALGGSLAAAISTRVGQGVINGLLTARIGLAAMHTCRPVPFTPDTRPSLGRIRAELLSLPKQVL